MDIKSKAFVYVCVTVWCGLSVIYMNTDSFKQPFVKISQSRLFTFLHRWPNTTNSDATSGPLYLKEEILRKGAKYNVSTFADANTSYIYLKQNATCHQGDLILVQIDLYDAQGTIKKTGGDFLRVWMEDPKNATSVSGQVSDHNNGSYSAAIIAVWAGHGTIRAFIATRREEIVYYYKIYEQYTSLWPAYADFRKKGSNLTGQSTCSITVPGDETAGNWCNFTLENNGFPWYCLKPPNKQLACHMWTYSFSGLSFIFKLNSSEDSVTRWSSKDPQPDILKRFVDVSIATADTASTLPLNQVACNKLPPYITWQRKSPNGFFHQDKWHSLLCHDTLPRTIDAYRQCLKGRTLWLHGDSTSDQFKKSLHSILRFQSHANGHMPVTDTDWVYEFSVSFQAHEFPFYHGKSHYPRSSNQAQHIMLDRLPNATKDIVVLYMYVHFTLVHPDVFRRHVRKLVPSAKNLLARAPNVTLAVRGPHAFFRSSKGLLSYWGLHYADIWHQEFASLRDKIVYLDFWDLTIAKTHYDFHPLMKTVHEMVHHMMSLLCHRK
ncbi:NXPE family member 3-like [Haliotis rufescens]|uniref:NXPE family member 3-like n=1 Tax=Haliotis rufescens TaxID=6454 RepID=UPI00201E870F|nr:NXPE family member 3-like [Haliotis rufescens]